VDGCDRSGAMTQSREWKRGDTHTAARAGVWDANAADRGQVRGGSRSATPVSFWVWSTSQEARAALWLTRDFADSGHGNDLLGQASGVE
jgi:hypothetical protein